ncbi:N-acetylserotonin O-methyltransferase-like protein [Lingula anatina]|uniref:N-acetylserotonin O-methyltransferase-like protein n=1 Tax=Lingula anatina TaxID=7574 RepID=A0A1S3H8A0_LINAN|nr:N-acetylserotonin O-methyltransferase-like protein [Lingula anatina]|eukprot:XP_013381349.1 N-acetylserotonin O-methyltransferase-like protein [Lingula anatina]
MLQSIKHKLGGMKIVLASGSPRRKLILENGGLQFEVIPSTFEENLDKASFSHAYEYVMETAKRKTVEVAEKLRSEQRLPDLIIGADTVVTMDDKIFEKPRDKHHAFEMLSGFSGRNHSVYTGVILLIPDSSTIKPVEDSTIKTTVQDGFSITQFYEVTEVLMGSLTPEVITAYIETGEPMDKAGGYGIQAKGGTLVETVRGDYFNIMGFPLHKFCKVLCAMLSDKKS